MAVVNDFEITTTERIGREGKKYLVETICFDIQCPDGTIEHFSEQQTGFQKFRDIDLHKKGAVAWKWTDIQEFEKKLRSKPNIKKF